MNLPEPGEILHDKYRLEEEVGRGGFAVVYRATDLTIGRAVALKVLKPGADGYEASVAARFTREARALAALSDAHTIRLFDYGRTESGLMFMAFELLEGVDLAEMLADGPLDEITATALLRQLLLSLREAHHAGILHRDIKPENIRVFRHLDELRLKLMDFGIARPMGPDAPVITRAGHAIGTPRYMSPEQLMGVELTPASDLFSVGLVVLEMLTGDPRKPLDDVYHGPGLRIACSPRLARVLTGLVQRDDLDRYQSADAVLTALDEPLQDVTHEPPHTPVTSSPDRNSSLLESRPAPWIKIGVVAIATLFVGILTLMALREPPEPQPAPPTISRQLGAVLKSAPSPKPVAARPLEVATADMGVLAPDSSAGSTASGCGSKQRPGNHSLGDAIGSGQFLIRVPGGYDPSLEHPVIFVFHGSGGSPKDLVEDGGLARLAEREKILLLSPLLQNGWSFRGDEDVTRFRKMLDETTTKFCVDPDRVFSVGHGTGGYAAEMLGCQAWIAGVATTSYRPGTPELLCRGGARPHISFAPTESRHIPLDGKNHCIGMKAVSLERWEEVLYERHQCSGPAKRFKGKYKAACTRWTCDSKLISCVVSGGRNWHGMTRRAFDVFGCDGTSPKYPYPLAIWAFFQQLEP